MHELSPAVHQMQSWIADGESDGQSLTTQDSGPVHPRTAGGNRS